MNEQPKSKVLIIFIGILLIANIVMLSFFLLNNKHNEDASKKEKEKMGKRNYVTDYLEKEVGFDTIQMARYDSLSQIHHDEIKSTYKAFSAERKRIFSALAAADFSDSAINAAGNGIREQQKIVELDMLRHLKDIRNICTEAQRTRFDTGFYKIFGKRGDTHK